MGDSNRKPGIYSPVPSPHGHQGGLPFSMRAVACHAGSSGFFRPSGVREPYDSLYHMSVSGLIIPHLDTAPDSLWNPDHYRLHIQILIKWHSPPYAV